MNRPPFILSAALTALLLLTAPAMATETDQAPEKRSWWRAALLCGVAGPVLGGGTLVVTGNGDAAARVFVKTCTFAAGEELKRPTDNKENN